MEFPQTGITGNEQPPPDRRLALEGHFDLLDSDHALNREEGLEAEPRHADELGRAAGLAAAEVAATFAVLELKGLARHVGGMWYVRG